MIKTIVEEHKFLLTIFMMISVHILIIYRHIISIIRIIIYSYPQF